MASLIDQIRSGDEQAVISFYQAYSPRILRYLSKKLPREEDAQEILNDVFMDAVDEIPTLRKEINLQAWLYKIASNKAADFYRKRKMKSFLFSQMPYLSIVAQEITQPEFQLEKNRIRDRIEQAFHEIAVHYQQVLRMHYEEKIPIKSIAVSLNLSEKATESLLYRARQSFIKSYERT